LNGPLAGPKTRAYYRQFFAENDFAKQIKLDAEKALRTCQGLLSTFSVKFKKLEKGRWLSGEVQSVDVCQPVIVYELTRKEGFLWSLKETVISIGNSPSCKAIADEKPLPAKFYTSLVVESEPQCDFISWFGGVGPSLSP